MAIFFSDNERSPTPKRQVSRRDIDIDITTLDEMSKDIKHKPFNKKGI